jgi:hypothetical protein
MECVQVNPARGARGSIAIAHRSRTPMVLVNLVNHLSPSSKLQVSKSPQPFPGPPRLPPNRLAAVPTLIAVPRDPRRVSRHWRDRIPSIHLHSRPRDPSGGKRLMASWHMADGPTRSRNKGELAMRRRKGWTGRSGEACRLARGIGQRKLRTRHRRGRNAASRRRARRQGAVQRSGRMCESKLIQPGHVDARILVI